MRTRDAFQGKATPPPPLHPVTDDLIIEVIDREPWVIWQAPAGAKPYVPSFARVKK